MYIQSIHNFNKYFIRLIERKKTIKEELQPVEKKNQNKTNYFVKFLLISHSPANKGTR